MKEKNYGERKKERWKERKNEYISYKTIEICLSERKFLHFLIMYIVCIRWK